jgi:hypothetical protein
MNLSDRIWWRFWGAGGWERAMVSRCFWHMWTISGRDGHDGVDSESMSSRSTVDYILLGNQVFLWSEANHSFLVAKKCESFWGVPASPVNPTGTSINLRRSPHPKLSFLGTDEIRDLGMLPRNKFGIVFEDYPEGFGSFIFGFLWMIVNNCEWCECAFMN